MWQLIVEIEFLPGNNLSVVFRLRAVGLGQSVGEILSRVDSI